MCRLLHEPYREKGNEAAHHGEAMGAVLGASGVASIGAGGLQGIALLLTREWRAHTTTGHACWHSQEEEQLALQSTAEHKLLQPRDLQVGKCAVLLWLSCGVVLEACYRLWI